LQGGPVEIAEGVFGLGSPTVNWYLVVEDGRPTAIDAGFPGFVDNLDADLETLGFVRGDIEAVVLTHSDGDHTGVAPALRDAGARVLIHEADAPALAKPGPKRGDASLRHVLANLRRREARVILADAIRNGGARPASIKDAATFADGEVLDVPGDPRASHTPGHTAGHCALLFAARGALFVGDAMINHPLITRGAGPRLMPHYTNESNARALDSLRRFSDIDAELTLFGHGEPWRRTPAEAAERARAATR
jgi:glyoxylase-like metal-dependent hydrolase (beta-lactamase superfamily II)